MEAKIELANRLNAAIASKGPIPIPNYAGLHFYNEFRVNGSDIQGRKARRWYCIPSNDVAYVEKMIAAKGF